jgi:hypothetical protein
MEVAPTHVLSVVKITLVSFEPHALQSKHPMLDEEEIIPEELLYSPHSLQCIPLLSDWCVNQ